MNLKNILKQRMLIITSLLLAIIVTSILIYVIPLFPSDSASQNSVLLVKLHQEDNRIDVAEMKIIEGYPPDYKINYQRNYLQFHILSDTNEILSSGTFLRKTEKIHESFVQGKQRGIVIEEPMNWITIYLSYFPNGKTLLITDDKKIEILRQDIDHSTLDTTSGNRHRCGNGICDQNENLISCFQDCRHY